MFLSLFLSSLLVWVPKESFGDLWPYRWKIFFIGILIAHLKHDSCKCVWRCNVCLCMPVFFGLVEYGFFFYFHGLTTRLLLVRIFIGWFKSLCDFFRFFSCFLPLRTHTHYLLLLPNKMCLCRDNFRLVCGWFGLLLLASHISFGGVQALCGFGIYRFGWTVPYYPMNTRCTQTRNVK